MNLKYFINYGRPFFQLFVPLVVSFLLFPSVTWSQEDIDEEFAITDIETEKNLADPSDIKKGIFDEDGFDVMTKIENIGNGRDDGMVVVEPRNVIPVNNSSKLEMVPYRLRREKWGQVWGVSYGLYTPGNYELDQIAEPYDEFYPSGIGLIQIEAIFKRNYETFSLGSYFSVGYFSVSSDVENFESDLVIMPIKLGFYGSLDTLWREPWVVPYVHGGIYSTYFDESTNGSSFNGTTLLAFYISGGLMIQLDWADDSTAREAYLESGIENTFLFIEGNYLSASIEEKDPEFDTIYLSAGLKLEF